MSRFSLVTHWHLEAPIDRVWDAIFHAEDWPRWWRYVERVDDIEPGSPSGVGAVRRFKWKTALLYTLTFELRATLIEPPYAIKGTASGEVEGVGTWRLSARDGVTRVRHEWDVRPTRAWMNALAPVAAPAFRWNHVHVMRAGGLALAQLLGARLCLSETRGRSRVFAS